MYEGLRRLTVKVNGDGEASGMAGDGVGARRARSITVRNRSSGHRFRLPNTNSPDSNSWDSESPIMQRDRGDPARWSPEYL